MITTSLAVKSLNELQKEFRVDTEAGQDCIETINQSIFFIQNLESEDISAILNDAKLGDFGLRRLKADIKHEIEKKQKEKLNKVLTLKKIVDKIIVEQKYYEYGNTEFIKRDTQEMLDNTPDDELIFTEIKVETAYLEDNDFLSIKIEGAK